MSIHSRMPIILDHFSGERNIILHGRVVERLGETVSDLGVIEIEHPSSFFIGKQYTSFTVIQRRLERLVSDMISYHIYSLNEGYNDQSNEFLIRSKLFDDIKECVDTAFPMFTDSDTIFPMFKDPNTVFPMFTDSAMYIYSNVSTL